MSDLVIRKEGPTPGRVYEAIEGEFLGQVVHYIKVESGRRYMVIEDVIQALRADSFSRTFLKYRLEGGSIGRTASVKFWSGVKTVIVGDIEDVTLVVLESNSPKASEFKEYAAKVLATVEQTGSYSSIPAEFANHPTLMLAQAVQQIVIKTLETEKRVHAIEQKAEDAKAIAEGVSAQVHNRTGFHSLLAYATRRGLTVPRSLMQQEGAALSEYCRRNGIPIGHVCDERWGKVNAYSEDVLENHWYPGFIARHPECKKKPWLPWR